MREFIDKTSKRFARIDVMEPVTITAKEYIGWRSSITTYLIKIDTNHWAFSLQNSEVRRRFSEFCWLRSKLICHHPNKIVPPLPPKRFFHITKFDPTVIEDRCQGLEKFIQRLMRSFVFLSDAAFHLFLQSELTITEIEAKLNEEIKPTYVMKRIHLTSDGRGVNNPELNRSCSSNSDNSSRSSIASDNDNEYDRTSSCGGGSSEMELDLDKIKIDITFHQQRSFGSESSDETSTSGPSYEVQLNTKEFDFSE